MARPEMRDRFAKARVDAGAEYNTAGKGTHARAFQP